MQNTWFGSKNKIARNMPKTSLQTHEGCSMQKTAGKNSWSLKNETTLKIAKNGHNARAIAHAKHLVWVRKWNLLKNAKRISTNLLKLFYAKNAWKKTANIKKMGPF